MLLSIVVPVFNERDSLPLLHEQTTAVMEDHGYDYELILVNDGSSDGSTAVLDRIAGGDERVKVVHLRRNYGQTAAMMAGIEHARGEVLIAMDADLQNDPADIPRLLSKLDEGYDVVSGWRKRREDKMLSRRLPSMIANWLISSVLNVRLHDYGCTLKAYRRDVLEDVRLYGEMHRFIPVYASWAGARVTELPVNHHGRRFGRSKYGIGRVGRVLLDLLLLYFLAKSLDRPIQFFGKIGFFALLLSFLSFGWALWLKVFSGLSLILTPLPLLSATLGLSGVIFVLLGVLAEIMSRNYFDAQNKRPYAIREVRSKAATAKGPKAKAPQAV